MKEDRLYVDDRGRLVKPASYFCGLLTELTRYNEQALWVAR